MIEPKGVTPYASHKPTAWHASCTPTLAPQPTQQALSEQEQQELAPYLQLHSVMRGASALLEATFGLRLEERPPLRGEVWGAGVRVFELLDAGGPTNGEGAGGLIKGEDAAGSPLKGQNAGSTFGGAKVAPAPPPQPPSSPQQRAKLLGTVFLDLGSGYGTLILHHGLDSAAPAEAQSAMLEGSTTLPEGHPATLPAVAVGLQQGSQLAGDAATFAAGLWELLHELGHAVHFLLSARGAAVEPLEGSGGDSSSGGSGSGGSSGSNSCAGGEQGTASGPSLHAHATWMPLELLELPSTLFEEFAMQPACLQLLCTHPETGAQLPAALAAKLTAHIRSSFYSPVGVQQAGLLMLADVLMAEWTSRQGSQAAHRLWRAVASLSALPNAAITVQQVGVPLCCCCCCCCLTWHGTGCEGRASWQQAAPGFCQAACVCTHPTHPSFLTPFSPPSPASPFCPPCPSLPPLPSLLFPPTSITGHGAAACAHSARTRLLLPCRLVHCQPVEAGTVWQWQQQQRRRRWQQQRRWRRRRQQYQRQQCQRPAVPSRRTSDSPPPAGSGRHSAASSGAAAAAGRCAAWCTTASGRAAGSSCAWQAGAAMVVWWFRWSWAAVLTCCPDRTEDLSNFFGSKACSAAVTSWLSSPLSGLLPLVSHSSSQVVAPLLPPKHPHTSIGAASAKRMRRALVRHFVGGIYWIQAGARSMGTEAAAGGAAK